jgi:ribose transport system substrate-binding protein
VTNRVKSRTGKLGCILTISGLLAATAWAPGAMASSGVTSPAQIAAAQKVVDAALKAPTKIGQDVPLKSVPPKGKTIVFVHGGEEQALTEDQALAKAAAAVGWTLKSIPFNTANPATLTAGLNQALQYKPTAVAFTGVPYALWAAEVPVFKKAGVILIPAELGPVPLSPTVPAEVGGPKDIYSTGVVIGNWFIADSKGKGKALLFNVPQAAILNSFADGFTKTVTKNCPGCSITDLNVSIADAEGGQSNPLAVSALQKNPSVQYFITSYGPFIDGLPSALAAAGLTGKLKIAGESADVQNEADVKNGTETAFEGFASSPSAWVIMDIALRSIEGMKMINSVDGGLPTQLLIKSNIGTPTDSYNYPSNYPQQFEKAWKVG